MSYPENPIPENYIPYKDNSEEYLTLFPDDENPVESAGTAEFEKPITDNIIHVDVNLPQGDKIQGDKVIGHTKDPNGDTFVKYLDNPLFNSVLYDVEFPDGEIKEYRAHIIADNMYSQVDAEGYIQNMMKIILDYNKDASAIDREDMYITTKSVQGRIQKTTLGWKLLVQWNNGTDKWIPLKFLKGSNPVELSEFLSAIWIESEHDFVWWVPFTLRKRGGIIAAVFARTKRVTPKYGVQLSYTVQ